MCAPLQSGMDRHSLSSFDSKKWAAERWDASLHSTLPKSCSLPRHNFLTCCPSYWILYVIHVISITKGNTGWCAVLSWWPHVALDHVQKAWISYFLYLKKGKTRRNSNLENVCEDALKAKCQCIAHLCMTFNGTQHNSETGTTEKSDLLVGLMPLVWRNGRTKP